MTEAEWLACNHPGLMLTHLGSKIRNRQLWLFGCACCRRIWNALTDDRSQAVIEFRERLDNGLASGEELQAAVAAAGDAIDDSTSKAMEGLGLTEVVGPGSLWDRRAPEVALNFATKAAASATSPDIAEWLAAVASRHVAEVVRCLHSGDKEVAYERELAAHCDVLRDVAGNPFRSILFCSEWRTDTAITLARQMYAARDFSAMPILADALQDAGCNSADILDHCRGPGPHVRGCWAVDLVLGK